MRLIDADALMEIIGQQGHLTVDDILNESAIDAVPVVRCGLCKHWKTEDDHCTHPAGLCATGKKARNNYCSLGERKDGEG